MPGRRTPLPRLQRGLLETLSFQDSPCQSSVTLGKGPSSPQAHLPPPGHHQGEKQGKAPSKKLPQKMRITHTANGARQTPASGAPGAASTLHPTGSYSPTPLSCRVLGDPAMARVWSAGPWLRSSSAWSLAGIQGEIKSSRGQEGPPGLDRRAQQAGPDRSGGTVSCQPPSQPSRCPPEPGPVLRGAPTRRGLYPRGLQPRSWEG